MINVYLSEDAKCEIDNEDLEKSLNLKEEELSRGNWTDTYWIFTVKDVFEMFDILNQCAFAPVVRMENRNTFWIDHAHEY